MADRAGINLSESLFKRGRTVEEEFEVVFVLEILDQRCLSQHCLKSFGQTVCAAFSSVSPFHVSEESFEYIVSSLGLDGYYSVWGIHDDRIREEFVPVLLDLVDHALVVFGRARSVFLG